MRIIWFAIFFLIEDFLQEVKMKWKVFNIYIILSHLSSFWGKRKKKKVELESWTERRENCAVAIASCETLSFHDSVANSTCSNRVRDAWWIVLSLVWGLRIFRTCFDNRIKLLIYSLFSYKSIYFSLSIRNKEYYIYIFDDRNKYCL